MISGGIGRGGQQRHGQHGGRGSTIALTRKLKHAQGGAWQILATKPIDRQLDLAA